MSLLALVPVLSGHAMVDLWLKRYSSPVLGHWVCDDRSKAGKGPYHAALVSAHEARLYFVVEFVPSQNIGQNLFIFPFVDDRH